MKKKMLSISALLIVLVMSLSMLVLPAFAAADPGEFKGKTLEKLRYYSSSETFGAATSQRGFGASADGKYLFGGFLAGTRAVVKFDAESGDPLASYPTGTNYPKGIATDDRGTLIIGMCNGEQKDSFTLATVDMATMKEVSTFKQDVGSGKVGVNGIAIFPMGEEYYLYVVVNYDFQRIYCFNVTDPKNITLNTEFGDNGFVDLAKLTGVKDCEGQYLDVDIYGDVYFSIYLGQGGDKSDGIYKIDSKGNIIATVDCSEAYYVSVYGDYLATSTYKGADSTVYIFDAESLEQIAEIKPENNEHAAFAGCALFRDKLYVGEQGYNNQSGFWVVEGFDLGEEFEEVVTDEVAADAADGAEKAPSTAEPISLIVCAMAVIAGAGFVATKKRF